MGHFNLYVTNEGKGEMTAKVSDSCSNRLVISPPKR